jgi:hypothetical protein
MFVNGEMIPVEIIPGSGEEEANSSMTYLVYCKDFCNCHNVPPAQQKKIKKRITY